MEIKATDAEINQTTAAAQFSQRRWLPASRLTPLCSGTSDSFPISTEGNARITAKFMLPEKCQIPALLIHPNGANAVYIATSGFTR